jgi:hypothetical protein
MLSSWLRGRARRATVRRPSLLVETLENRLAPAVGTSFVNDNWAVITDVGTPGLSAGDTVRNDNDTINPGTIVGVFGTDAFSSINNAVANTVAFGTVNVLEGTYTENVTINVSNLTLRSLGGRALTTINGISDGSLGTVVIAAGTNNVTIGQTGAGFTINGIDYPSPASESAAVYLQGNQTGTVVRDNKIVANGDEAILSEFGATVSNVTVDGNEIAGVTFAGATPGGDATLSAGSQQFVVPNYPRQLVVLSGGSGGGNTSNVTFTNNLVDGVSGGTNATGLQGNILVTIDSNVATISGNTFAGTVTRAGTDALRARGPSTTISGNTFVSTNMSPATAHVEIANTGQTLDQIAAANTFDRYAFVPGGSTTGQIGVDLQTAINAVATGATIQTFGTFPGDVTVNKAVTILGNFGATGAVNVTASGAVIDGAVNAGAGLTLTAGSTLVVDLSSATAFDQSSVTGMVTLNGATLQLNSVFTPALGSSFTIIKNDGTDAVVGTFAGLAEGATLTVNGTTYTISYKGGDGNDVTLSTQPALQTLAVGTVGTTGGNSAQVAIVDPRTGTVRLTVTPFAGYQGGVRVATGDVNNDGVDDVIVVNTVGQANVVVFDGKTGTVIRSFLAFQGYLGGVNVASGDVNGDGFDDVIVSTSGVAVGQVMVFSGANNAVLASYQPYAGFTGNVLVASADVNGDTIDDVITLAAGVGHVKVFSGATQTELASFVRADLADAVSISAGDQTGDGKAELFADSATGSLRVIDPRTQALLQSLTPFAGYQGRLSVAATNADGDNLADLAVAAEQSAGVTLGLNDSFQPVDAVFAFGQAFNQGVTVG